MDNEIKTYTRVDLDKLTQLERTSVILEVVGERLTYHPSERKEVRYINANGSPNSYPIDARFGFGVWLARRALMTELHEADCDHAMAVAIRRGMAEARRVV